MKRYIFVLGIILLLVNVGCTNSPITVSGNVKDSITGLPVKDAKVTDGIYGYGNYCITNSSGYYSYLTYCEEHTITIEANGYLKKEITMITPFFPNNKDIVLDIILNKIDY
ncbi:MAG: hypothetical protein AMQ22_02097 [Candidatus Methanofastidiosum methylothiophilum]|jgi:hypothetical protein|uniref:Cna protein B-type domain protein n=1 Tax=Candidatus Methanofastidiosum methylothiophilum TaxID=1705564 RepID=A0A150INI7_9EURY|nr:MAG: hypothetical protein AMQ22_02097 [Candidatus Methanofastidiosum methylthiophilus]